MTESLMIDADSSDEDMAITLVREFHSAFGSDDDLALRKTLIAEEIQEFIEAVERHLNDKTLENLAEVLKEACDVAYVIAGTFVTLDNLGTTEFPLSDEEVALIVHTSECAVSVFGHDIMWEGFKRVHESNMSKLGVDGKPIYRHDGKVLKGPNYKPCDLRDLVAPIHERMMSGGQ
jgi:predicted HAD superfamily Cof-like phosphohydrolase